MPSKRIRFVPREALVLRAFGSEEGLQGGLPHTIWKPVPAGSQLAAQGGFAKIPLIMKPPSSQVGLQGGSPAVSLGGGQPPGTLTSNGTTIHTHEPVFADTNIADDFSPGRLGYANPSWYIWNCDEARARSVPPGSLYIPGVYGWCGTIFNGSGSDGTIIPAGAVTSLGSGFYAADSGDLGGDTTGNMADKDVAATRDFYFRYYIKLYSGYNGGAEKVITLNSWEAGNDGITIGGIGSPFGDFAYDCCPVYDCNILDPYPAGEGVYYYRQNPSITGNPILHIGDYTGRWFFVENYVRMNTGANTDGEWKLWIDDCGSGTLPVNPSGSPTLRARYGPGIPNPNGVVRGICWNQSGPLVRSLWLEAWSNPSTAGRRILTMLQGRTSAPVGFSPLFNAA